jgi:uncharacterized protein YdbL (DUF1318 family)
MQTPNPFHRPSNRLSGRLHAAGAVALTAVLAAASCTWRTEHKIETVSKIDAHIVLDIRQIQDQAAQNEAYVRKDEPTTTTKAAGEPTSYLASEAALRRMAQGGGSWFFAAAHAQPERAESGAASADDNKKALEGRKERFKKLDDALTKGLIGENEQGFVEVRMPKDAPDKELRASAAKLAEDENADRKTIYRYIAQDQHLGADGAKKVGEVYAAEIRKQLKKGQEYQAPRDPKLFADFQQTALGKAHPDAKPGDWIKKTIEPEKKG